MIINDRRSYTIEIAYIRRSFIPFESPKSTPCSKGLFIFQGSLRPVKIIRNKSIFALKLYGRLDAKGNPYIVMPLTGESGVHTINNKLRSIKINPYFCLI
jgi:hypothetical protein